MDIFDVLSLAGGLAFFLYGMNVMSAGLEKLAGSRLETALKRMTSNVWSSLALGAGITIAIQSSSALTVMLVGLVNSGIMEIGQTVGVIMGSNIGTTLTAWLTSLTGIDSGGPIALVEDGDRILIDVVERRIELLVSDEELERRRAAWRYTPAPVDGYLARYARNAKSADQGGIVT